MRSILGRRSGTLAAAGILLLAMVPAGTQAGDAHVVTDDPLHGSYLYQRMPGDMTYGNISRTLVWESEGEGISTAVLVEDLDGNGLAELVFGTDDGRVLSIEVATRDVVLDLRPTDTEVQSLVVGNVDVDEADEIVLTAADGVYCYDAQWGEPQWSRGFEALDSQVLLVKAMDGGDGGRDEVVVLRTVGSTTRPTSHLLERYDGDGLQMLWMNLVPPGGSSGSRASAIAADLDADGATEVFVSDRYQATVGSSGNGRNIWIVDVHGGTIVKSMAVAHVVFESEPMLVGTDEGLAVAIGLSQGWDGINDYDLAVYEGREGTFRYMDVYNDSRGVAWSHLGFVPEGGGWTVLATSTGDMHAFQFDAPGLSWSWSTTGGRSLRTNPVSCDIDGDGTVELLVPDEGITVLGTGDGGVEARVEPPGGRAVNIRLTLGDVDGDGRSEVVWGYLDDEDRDAYQLHIVGQLEHQEAVPDIDPIWGWALVIFVLVGNVVMLTYLVMDWNRRKGAE